MKHRISMLIGFTLIILLAITPGTFAQLQGEVAIYQGQPSAILQRLIVRNQLSGNLVSSIEIQKTDILNAYTNGQKIILTRGIWEGLTTDDMRAFVIGHELAHVLLRHVEKTQARRVGFALLDRMLLQRIVPSGSLLDKVDSIGLMLLERRFSRDVEYQADDLGLQLMKKAGYNPSAALAVFRFLGQHHSSGTPEFLSSHPISQSRIRHLVQRYKLSTSDYPSNCLALSKR